MQVKSETLTKFKVFKAMIEATIKKKIQILWIDRRGEFLSKQFDE